MTFVIIGFIVFVVAAIVSFTLSEFDHIISSILLLVVAILGLALGVAPIVNQNIGYVENEPRAETVNLAPFDGAYHVDKNYGYVFYKDLGAGKIEKVDFANWEYRSVDLQADSPNKAYLEIVTIPWTNFWGDSGERKTVKVHLPRSAASEIVPSSDAPGAR